MRRKRFYRTVGLALALLFMTVGAVPAAVACTDGCCDTTSGMSPSHAVSPHFESRSCCKGTSPVPCCHLADGAEDMRRPVAINAVRQLDPSFAPVLMTATAGSDLDKAYDSEYASNHQEGSRADPVPVYLLNLSLLI